MKYVKVCDQFVPVEQPVMELLFKYHNEEASSLTEEEGLTINKFLRYVKSMRCSSCRTKCKTLDVIIDQAVDELFEFPVQPQVI
ncbi:MAG: hypothetical protein BWK79_17350, partial [Beggiatoa sp. IS2]